MTVNYGSRAAATLRASNIRSQVSRSNLARIRAGLTGQARHTHNALIVEVAPIEEDAA